METLESFVGQAGGFRTCIKSKDSSVSALRGLYCM